MTHTLRSFYPFRVPSLSKRTMLILSQASSPTRKCFDRQHVLTTKETTCSCLHKRLHTLQKSPLTQISNKVSKFIVQPEPSRHATKRGKSRGFNPQRKPATRPILFLKFEFGHGSHNDIQKQNPAILPTRSPIEEAKKIHKRDKDVSKYRGRTSRRPYPK